MKDPEISLKKVKREIGWFLALLVFVFCLFSFGFYENISQIYANLSSENTSSRDLTINIIILAALCTLSCILIFSAIWMRKVSQKLIQKQLQLENANSTGQQTINTLHYVLNQSDDYVLFFDKQGLIIDANGKTFTELEYTFNELIGHCVSNIDLQFVDQDWSQFWQHLIKHEKLPLETQFIKKEGTAFNVTAEYHYTVIGEKEVCFCIARDTSVLKTAQEQLLLATEKAHELSSRLHKNIERAGKMTLKATNNKAIKNELTTTIGSDIKTSLKSVMNMLDYLYKTAFGDTQQTFSQTAHSTSFSLMMTINNILDSTQLEADELILDRTVFKLQNVIQNVFKRLQPIAKERQIKLHAILAPDFPQFFRGDAKRIERIFFNLISNALIYNKTGNIYIKLKELNEEKNDSLLEVVIKDHEEDIGTNLKETDPQIDSLDKALLQESHEFKLRLNISQSLLELMQGKLWHQHKMGVGSTHFFTLHLETVKAPLSEKDLTHSLAESDLQQNKEPNETEPLNILVCEDGFIQQQIIRLMVRAQGHKYTNVKTGEQTLKKLREKKFDILLIDTTTPKGLKMLQSIQSLSSGITHGIYIIGMTSLPHSEVQHCLTQLNINDIISKPIDEEELLLAIRCAQEHKKKKQAPQKPPFIPELAATAPISSSEQAERFQSNGNTGTRFDSAESADQPFSDEEISALISLTGSPENSAETEEKTARATQPHELAEQAIIQLKKNFIETTPQLIKQIHQATTDKDAEVIITTTTAMEASTAYFDAEELESVTTKIRLHAKANRFSKIKLLIADLEDAFITTIEKLQAED